MLASTIGKALAGAALTIAATAVHAVSYEIHNSLGSMLTSVQAMGPTTFGTGTFVGVGCPPGVACPGVAVNGLPGVSFALNGGGSASYSPPGLLNNLGSNGYLEWSFTTPQNGWGGTFNMALNNGLSFTANDKKLGWIDVTTVSANQALTNNFLGFSSTDQFSGVRVGGILGAATSYNMTDVSIAAAVPEPGEWAMMLAGLAVLGFVVKRRRAAA